MNIPSSALLDQSNKNFLLLLAALLQQQQQQQQQHQQQHQHQQQRDLSLRLLESLFAINPDPGEEAIELIAQRIDSTSYEVANWFQVRREQACRATNSLNLALNLVNASGRNNVISDFNNGSSTAAAAAAAAAAATLAAAQQQNQHQHLNQPHHQQTQPSSLHTSQPNFPLSNASFLSSNQLQFENNSQQHPNLSDTAYLLSQQLQLQQQQAQSPPMTATSPLIYTQQQQQQQLNNNSISNSNSVNNNNSLHNISNTSSIENGNLTNELCQTPTPTNCPSSSLLAKLNAVTTRPNAHMLTSQLDPTMIDLLEAFYSINDNPEPNAIEMIARRINVSSELITDWFDKKRLKLNPYAGPRSPPVNKKREGGRVMTFSEYQRSLLEAIFNENNYLHPQEYEELSKLIQVPSRNIKIWFKNRRSKQRLVYKD